MSNGSTYIPDFYDEINNIWYEVKGNPKDKSIEKFNLFIHDYPLVNIKILFQKELEDNFYVKLDKKTINEIMNKWRIDYVDR